MMYKQDTTYIAFIIKYLSIISGVCCAFLNIDAMLVGIWIALMFLDSIMGMLNSIVADNFKWRTLRIGFIGKLGGFVVIISFALVGVMTKKEGIDYLGLGIESIANMLIVAQGATEALSVLSHYRVLKGKEPIPEIDVFGIFGKRFKKGIISFIGGQDVNK